MDERLDPRTPPELEHVRSKVEGGAFPHPPILPVVAVLALLLGLSLGFGLAPKQAAVSSESPSPTPPLEWTTNPPTFPVDNPTAPDYFCWGAPPCASIPIVIYVTPEPTVPPSAPTGGVTMAQAVAAAKKAFKVADKDILAVRLVDGTQYYFGPSTDGWFWEVVVRGPGAIPCGGILPASESPSVTPDPQASGEVYCIDEYDAVIVDYRTGEALGMSSATYP